VVSSFALAGLVAVKLGGTTPLLGILAGAAVGTAAGLIQSVLVVWLSVSSVAITLGGFLAMWGLTNALAHGTEVAYSNL
jgi:ribose/xylose/arabinose/galactoside ABC-type transport system permease subunit